MLGDLLTVAKEIRDLMRQNAVQERSERPSPPTHAYILSDTDATNAPLEAPHQSDDPPEVSDATTREPLGTDAASLDTKNESK